MKVRNKMLGSVAPFAILAMSYSAAWADTFDRNPLIDTSGDGLVYVDTDEGVIEPGIQGITFTTTRVDGDDGREYVDPFENIVTDYSDLQSRGSATNCLMASNPDVYCDSASGSGKRIKTHLTGREAFDVRLRTTASPDTPSVDYFNFGKVSNYSGARMTGLELQLLDADGNPMGDLDPDAAVLFNLDATSLGIGSGLPDGLFGEGGNEGAIGFLSDEKAKLTLTSSSDVLAFGALTNPDYVAHFGDALLDDTMVPDGMFWDDNDDPDDEGALVAWNNIANGGWTYGTLDVAENIDARLGELATALGVEVADLNYAAGGLLPDDIVAAAEANGLFEVDAVEDLRNANLNYTLTVGTVEGGELIVRTAPSFAPIVESATTEAQFLAAGYLDAAANVPYLDEGNAEDYQAAITSMMVLDAAGRARALDSLNFGYAPALSSLAFEGARDQVATVLGYNPLVGAGGETGTVSTMGTGDSWAMGQDMYGITSISGSKSVYDPTATSLGYDVAITSVSVGLEKHLPATTSSVGLALGYTNGTATADRDVGEINAEGYSLTAYSRNAFADGGMFQALIGYQDLAHTSTRSVLDDEVGGSTDGSQIFAAFTFDYMQDMGGFKVGPTASVEYYNVSTDAFSEDSDSIWALNVNEQSTKTVLASVGVRGEYTVQNAMGESHISGALKYTKASSDDIFVETTAVNFPGTSYTAPGMDQDLIDVTFGFDTVMSTSANGDVILQGGYRGSFGDDYKSQGISIGVNMTF